MNFYNNTHPYYCGIDLHAKTLYVCILDQDGNTCLHKEIADNPEKLQALLEPYTGNIVVGVECMHCWYWVSDFCENLGVDFILGHALYMKAIHGGKAKNDRIDSFKIANLIRGGNFPLAYVYPKEMRATRDLLRRRMKIVRHGANLKAHVGNTTSQYNLPPNKVNLKNVSAREQLRSTFPDPVVQRNIDLDMAVLECYAKELSKIEWFLEKKRKEKEEETGQKARDRTPRPPQAGPRDKDQVNFTDEESRIMPSSDGFVQAYNAQAAVDIDTHLIVESHITQQPNDKQEIEPTLKQLNAVEDSLGKPDGLLADTGYFSEGNVKRCEANEIAPYISGSRERHNLPRDERFNSLPPCPEDADAVTVMAHRLRTSEGKAIYAKRKPTVETVFGIIKEVLGFRQFHLRGLDSAQGEWNLVCMAWNLKRMYALAVLTG